MRPARAILMIYVVIVAAIVIGWANSFAASIG
jgi:hypothetical protein